MNTKTFMERYSGGVILRVYSTNPDKVDELVNVTKQAVEKMLAIKLHDRPVINKILIVVWNAEEYKDVKGNSLADCGLTYDAMVKALGGTKGLSIYKEDNEDLFCGLLNRAYFKLAQQGCKYAWIISPHAHEYITANNVLPMVEALAEGAWVSGLAISELEESILFGGQIANTFAVWHIEHLHNAGGFNKIAAMEKDASQALFMRGWDSKNEKEAHYPYHGVEEIPTLISFALDNKQVIAPIRVVDKGSYIPPSDPEAIKRHLAKMLAKLVRKNRHAMVGFGVALDIILRALMPKYRHN